MFWNFDVDHIELGFILVEWPKIKFLFLIKWIFYNICFIILIIYLEKFLKCKSILKFIKKEIDILILWEGFNILVYFKQAGGLSYVFAAVAYV